MDCAFQFHDPYPVGCAATINPSGARRYATFSQLIRSVPQTASGILEERANVIIKGTAECFDSDDEP
tara:strand:+ start:581 stop:781 length:201 start_codon:yes stop_codon:yes gene_type:complete